MLRRALILAQSRQLHYLHSFLFVRFNGHEAVPFGYVALQLDVVLEVLLHFREGDDRLPKRIDSMTAYW